MAYRPILDRMAVARRPRSIVWAVAVAVGLWVPAAHAQDVNAPVVPKGERYVCAPVPDSSAEPPPLPENAYEERAANPVEPPKCPEGEAPWPQLFDREKATNPAPGSLEAKRAYPSDAAARRLGQGATRSNSSYTQQCRTINPSISAFYCHVDENQFYPNVQGTFALWGTQSQHQPYVAAPGAHSLSQLWMHYYPYYPQGNFSSYSSIEFGWRVSASDYGDALPHLFAYHFDGGYGTPYQSGFVPYPGAPDLTTPIPPTVTPGPSGVGWTYGIQLNGYGWWLYWGGYWLGYFPPSAWQVVFPPYANWVAAGGEVASPTIQPSYIQMANGLFGSNPIGTWTAGVWHSLWRTWRYSNPVSQYVQPNINSASDYRATANCVYDYGNRYPTYGQFTYGGPGWAYARC
jgi:Neprosin